MARRSAEGGCTLRINDGKSRSLFWLLVCAFCLPLTGCGSKLPRTVSVQGKVIWQGRPLTDGVVFFNPARSGDGQETRPARGDLGPDGMYHLSSFRPNDGAMPGEYRVTVESLISRPNAEQLVVKPAVWRIPSRYGDPTKSGLSFTVPSDARGSLVFDIDIK
jgi:hypothetical protein